MYTVYKSKATDAQTAQIHTLFVSHGIPLINLSTDRFTVCIDISVDATPLRGNCINSDGATYDKHVETAILRQVAAGNNAAWACTQLTIESYDTDISGTATLGRCSYSTVDDLVNNVMGAMFNDALDNMEQEMLGYYFLEIDNNK